MFELDHISYLQGLKEIADSLVSANANRLITDGTMHDFTDRLDDLPGSPLRY